MDDEPRYMLIDLKTMKQVRLTTDEIQCALWLAELGKNNRDSTTIPASNNLPKMQRNYGGNTE